MKLALLFRGPMRLEPHIHVAILLQSYSMISRLFSCDVEPFLLTYVGAAANEVEDALGFAKINKIREPDEKHIDSLGEPGLYIPFANGGSRVNAYKQYYSMNNWVKDFRGNTFGCSHVFYARTDVALDIPGTACWLNEDGYTTAHAKTVDDISWTCDYVGAAPTDIFCDAWDFDSESHLLSAVLKANKGEDPLDMILAQKGIKLYIAEMRFGGHLIRASSDLDVFWSGTSGG